MNKIICKLSREQVSSKSTSVSHIDDAMAIYSFSSDSLELDILERRHSFQIGSHFVSKRDLDLLPIQPREDEIDRLKKALSMISAIRSSRMESMNPSGQRLKKFCHEIADELKIFDNKAQVNLNNSIKNIATEQAFGISSISKFKRELSFAC